MLLFKKKFLDAIRGGTKTQTVRLWKYRRMKVGQRSYIPGAGYIRVHAVDEVALEDLTDEDAVRDGFDTANALRAEIESIYAASQSHDQRPFRIQFSLLPPDEQAAAQAKKRVKAAARRD